MVKIMLDAGHGGHDPGAVGNNLREKDLTLTLVKKIRTYLNTYQNVEVLLTRDTDVFLELGTRANIANKAKVDAFVSVHINSATNRNATGYEDFIFIDTKNQNTVNFQKIVNHNISSILKSDYNMSNRGAKRANLAVLRLTNMPAILTEIGFISNKIDADLLSTDDFLNRVAEAHAIGIASYFSLKKKAGVEKPKPVDENTIPSHSHKESWEWGTKLGLVNSKSPEKPVTREQLMTILMRYSKLN